ncbi:MAG: ATP-dependent zinc metalloprotease FtsH, partial [Chloroflexota bacterium]
MPIAILLRINLPVNYWWIKKMKQNNDPKRKSFPNRIVLVIAGLIVILVVVVIAAMLPKKEPPVYVSLSDIAAAIADGKITKIEDTLFAGEFYAYYQDGKKETGVRDPGLSLLEQLDLLGVTGEQLSEVKFEIVKSSRAEANAQTGILLALVFIGLPVTVALVASRRDVQGKKGFKGFDEACVPELSFNDVAGLDENLQELRDVVTFLKDGSKFADIGAKMPRGVLMVGDPGTGKTLIAKAVAGEAGVPFFATSGSEFVEMFVGVGAGRIRSLFRKARKKAPCIVFIDEVDAVGRARHRSESGAEAEQDQTLNQLLVEMDGFESDEGVVILAATNRMDVLDSALTRPGRFDRRVYVNRPDIKGREAILKIHAKGKKLALDVILADVARATPGLVGADLANIINEAAITAVSKGHTEIRMIDFEEAIEKEIAGGVQRKNQVMSADEKKIIAYHEAGHAIVMHETDLCDPVYKITIIPRGQAAGYTMALPEQDTLLISRKKMLARITGLLGGRAAEDLFFQDITSGAANDLDVATQLAEEMVMRLGMDDTTGLRVFPQSQGRSFSLTPPGSQKTIETIDEAVNNILNGCYADAKAILQKKCACVDKVAAQLLEIETIDREQ